jgi:opacity protein-like surface antigen
MKKIFLAAALAAGLAAAPVAASASITLTTLELVGIILGAGVVGHAATGHAHGHSGHGILGLHGHSHGLNKWQVMRLQRDLHNMGCNPGPIDGVIGPRTRAAIARCY